MKSFITTLAVYAITALGFYCWQVLGIVGIGGLLVSLYWVVATLLVFFMLCTFCADDNFQFTKGQSSTYKTRSWFGFIAWTATAIAFSVFGHYILGTVMVIGRLYLMTWISMVKKRGFKGE